MKPIVDLKRCFASQSVCTAMKCCPTEAISYIEVDEPILDKILSCNCAPPTESEAGGCGCGEGECGDDLYSCGGTPYGRIIIDYDECIECGLCAKECCGSAIDLIG